MSKLIRTTKTDRLMRTYYPSGGTPILCAMLGLEPEQVRNYAYRLGIKTRHRGGKPFARGHDSRRGTCRPFARQDAHPFVKVPVPENVGGES